MKISKLDTTAVPHVLVFEEAIPQSYCEKFVNKFEANEDDEQVRSDFGNTRHFIEINISQHWADDHTLMVNLVTGAAKSYMSMKNIIPEIQFPKQFGYEQFRMKRYLPNGKDEFALHTDVGNYASARRFLSFLWYLNTVQQGGETGFGKRVENPDLIIPAVQGRLLIFPPLWTHPHWGCKTISGPKYIISGYLHYI